MLELKNLVKSYKTAGFEQTALDGVSVTLRDNEFVAVLGPSGSGKTTLLNIVGGLDRYDSGDLVIDGISTKEYKDRDWDTYRNNRVGFVFQSYNLIPHQTVLSNVELALTLSGVPKSERRERARAALEQVGLTDHINKRPNQLSGGQMQRVAIARALINDPEILLADEPTGALDSKTSVQIMDMLKAIAADRLVVMVTHNPDLADEYANRVVKLADGKVVSDSNPVSEEDTNQEIEARPARQAKMSFLTAIALSFSNLMTKKGRTLMMAFAGSIGIIGIAAILSLSNGVNNYIASVEESTLSEYPLTIQSTGFDIASLLVGTSANADDSSDSANSNSSSDSASSNSSTATTGSGSDTSTTSSTQDSVNEMSIVNRMFSQVSNNDLAALKEYLDNDGGGINQYVNSIQYAYDVTPQIFDDTITDTTRQVNPDSSFQSLGIGSGMSSSAIMSMSMSTDMFAQLPDDLSVLESQYEVLAGRWPESHEDIVLVISPYHSVTDLLSYTLGLRDSAQLQSMVDAFANGEEIVAKDDRMTFSYEQLMAPKFKLVYATDYYKYDAEYSMWVNHKDDEELLKQLVENGLTLNIVGIVASSGDAPAAMLQPGLYYTEALRDHIVEQAAQSQVVKDQLASPELDVFTNKTFAEEADNSNGGFDMGKLFSIDTDALNSAFSFGGGLDMGSMSSMGAGAGAGGGGNPAAAMPSMPPMDLTSVIGQVPVTPGMQTDINTLISSVMSGYAAWYSAQSLADPTGYPPADIGNHFSEYLSLPQTQADIAAELATSPDLSAYGDQLQGAFNAYMQQYIGAYVGAIVSLMTEQMTAQMTAVMSSVSSSLSALTSSMSALPDIIADAFQFNMDEKELQSMMMSLLSGNTNSYANNLAALGYADYDNPFSINIYPLDFEAKQHVLDILDSYNQDMKDADKEDQVITYSDIVGTLMSSVTEIVDMISMVLVAFVAISLVVSSIMIGVITYISVLERKKEIGILRSIGASKGDIGNVFNAETIIIGFVAGMMGIIITLALSVPANIIVESAFDVPNIAILPIGPAAILVGVSVVLTFIAGLMPSSAASRKDPVEALRAE